MPTQTSLPPKPLRLRLLLLHLPRLRLQSQTWQPLPPPPRLRLQQPLLRRQLLRLLLQQSLRVHLRLQSLPVLRLLPKHQRAQPLAA